MATQKQQRGAARKNRRSGKTKTNFKTLTKEDASNAPAGTRGG